jgi:phage terminase large subunit GpA-like protein
MRGRLGDVWELLEDRLTTFGYRAKHVGVSTPTAASWRAYQRSDRRRF